MTNYSVIPGGKSGMSWWGVRACQLLGWPLSPVGAAAMGASRCLCPPPLPQGSPTPSFHPKGNQHPQFLGIFSEICYTKMSRYTFIVFPALSPMVVCCLRRSVPHCLLYVMTRVSFPTFSPPHMGLFEVLLLSIHLPIINVLKP